MSKFEHRVVLAFFIFIFLFILTIVWVVNAVRVDLNGLQYKSEISLALDLNRSIGSGGDKLQAERIEMQNSDFWALRLAASITFIQRLLITAVFLFVTYWSAIFLIRSLVNLQREIIREEKKKRWENKNESGIPQMWIRSSFLFFFWCFYWTALFVWQNYSNRLDTIVSLVLWYVLIKILLNIFTTTLSYHFKFLHNFSTINFSI